MKKSIPLLLGLLLAACGGSSPGSESAAGRGAAMMADSSAMAQPAQGAAMMGDSGMMHDSMDPKMMRDSSGMGSMEQSPGGASHAMADTSGMGRD